MRLVYNALARLVAAALLVGSSAAGAGDPAASAAAPAAHPPVGAHTPTTDRTGVVLETMVASGYRYVLLDGPQGKVWLAGPESDDIEVGTTVVSSTGTLMSKFHSKTLDRTFERIWFVSRLGVQELPDGAAHVTAERAQVGAIPAAPSGLTVASVHERAASLVGQQVAVRGEVVRFTPAVQERNWVHLQDGTGDEGLGTHDLTVTTQEQARVGDVIVVRGTVATDRDYGYGYHYDVVIESASIVTE